MSLVKMIKRFDFGK